MSELPPPFFSEPVRAFHVEASDEAFTGPARLAREAAAVTLVRNDGAMADLIGRGWRSGAPEELLDSLLCGYASAHELDPDEATAIASVSRFVPAVACTATEEDVALLAQVALHVTDPLGMALSVAQEDDEPCWCVACIAEAASLN